VWYQQDRYVQDDVGGIAWHRVEMYVFWCGIHALSLAHASLSRTRTHLFELLSRATVQSRWKSLLRAAMGRAVARRRRAPHASGITEGKRQGGETKILLTWQC